MREKPEFHVGDLVRIKTAYATPDLVGKVRKVERVTETRVYVENHINGWNITNPNIYESLEIIEPAARPMDDTREYLDTITNMGN